MQKILCLCLTTLLLSGLTAKAEKAGPKELTKMVYAAPTSLPAAIYYLASIKGFFKEEGLDVDEKLFSSGRDALQSLLANQAQLQSVSETPVAHAIVQGNDIVTIATVSFHHEARLIGRRDKGIAKPEDLKGKKIGTAAGTNSDYFMYTFLKKHGMKASDVQIMNMKAPDMKVALVKGELDGYFAWEPHIYYAKKELGKNGIEFAPGDLYNGFQTVNMNRDYVKKNPETVRKVIRALLKAESFIEKNPTEAKSLIAKKLQIDEADIDSMWSEIKFKVELSNDLEQIMESVGKWSAEVNNKTAPDFSKHIYKDALLLEKKSAVTLKN